MSRPKYLDSLDIDVEFEVLGEKVPERLRLLSSAVSEVVQTGIEHRLAFLTGFDVLLRKSLDTAGGRTIASHGDKHYTVVSTGDSRA